MEKIMTIGVVIVMLLAGFLFGKSIVPHNGKYNMYIDPTRKSEKFILDTESGKVWQYTKEADSDHWYWQEMPKTSRP